MSHIIYCKSCDFPINEGETTKPCSVCEGLTHAFCNIVDESVVYCDNCHIVKDQELVSATIELPEHIRRSHIETYRSCPTKFKWEVIDGVQQPANKYTQVGIDLHELFEKGVKDTSYTKEQMREEYYRDFEHLQAEAGLYTNEKDRQDFRDRADVSIETFYEIMPELPPMFEAEKTLKFSVGEGLPEVSFTMDLITENEHGNLDLHDWKTGRVIVGKTIEYDMQAPLYIYGVQQHYGRTVDSFTFHYLKEKKTRVFNRVQGNMYECKVGKRSYFVDLIDMVREVQSVFNKVKKADFNIPSNTKSMFFACKMCHIKAQGDCEGAERESWKQLNGR